MIGQGVWILWGVENRILRVAGVTAGLAESNGSLPPGLWLTSPAGWLPRTGISSGTLRSVIEYGLPLHFYIDAVNAGLALQREAAGDTVRSQLWQPPRPHRAPCLCTHDITSRLATTPCPRNERPHRIFLNNSVKYARCTNNAMCTQARKTTHGLDGQHQDVDRTPRGRAKRNDRGQR